MNPMEDSDHIWHWCRASKKVFPMSKIQAAGLFSVAKIETLVDHVPRSNIRKGKQQMDPVQNSIPEVDYVKNGDSSKSPIVILDHVSSCGASSDTISDHPRGDSGPGVQFLRPSVGNAGGNSGEDLSIYQRKQPSKFRLKRRGQKEALKHRGLLSDEGMKGSSDQYTAWNRETSMEASSSCSISKMVAENMQPQSRVMNGEMKKLGTVAGSENSSSYINLPCYPPVSKKPKRNQSLISEAGERLLKIENQDAKSEILFRKLHLLAEASVLVLENGQAALSLRISEERKRLERQSSVPLGYPSCRREYSEEPEESKVLLNILSQTLPRCFIIYKGI